LRSDCGTVTIKFLLHDVAWQQASKHIKKSIISSTVSMYQSRCLVLSGQKEEEGKFWICWFKPCGIWHCFNWWKATFNKRILLTTSGFTSGRIMKIYFKKLVNFAWFIKSYLLISDTIRIHSPLVTNKCTKYTYYLILF
jgi:hypothetical protein